HRHHPDLPTQPRHQRSWHTDAHELAEMEARLAETDGLRPAIQAQARSELTAEGKPVIRSTVARRACAILDLHQMP
ncbi:MAG TPA: hypothetical protein VIJ15_13255, partial [Dermatophilaceae bacterium]